MTIIPGATSSRLTAALSDRYRIERELGQGGMATVYLAHDIRHKRHVAIKVLKPDLAAVIGAERFVQEITTTAALQHPHILPLFDSGTVDGFLYYVMPFIDGETLRTKLDRETQLAVDEAVRLATDIADALQYAHEQGVIHRDIKPENILLHKGRPMIADFGIALALSAAAGGRMTETGLSLGTPHYMSPEQATAEKEISARSDVYSLASVLYEMLAGNPPHTGSSAQQIIMKIITEEAQPVTQLRKAVPANVSAALAKALEKLPADRFESARSFSAALHDTSFTMSGATLFPGAGSRSWRGWIENPRSWVVISAAVLLAVTPWVFRALARTGTPDGSVIRATITGPVDSAFVSMPVTESRNASEEPVVSPDSRHIAFGVHKLTGKTVYVRALNSAEFTETSGSMPFFSSDGAAVGFIRESEVWTMSLTERVPTRVGAIPEQTWYLYASVWHPDGRIIVSGSRGLWSIRASGGEPTLLLAADSLSGEHFADVSALSDGRLLLTTVTRKGAHLEVASANASTRQAIMPGAEAGWMIDGILVFAQSGQLRASRFDLDDLKPVGEPVALPSVSSRRLSRSIAWVDSTTVAPQEVVWVSTTGAVVPTGLPVGEYRWPRVSANATSIAAGLHTRTAGHPISVFALNGRSATPLQGYSEPVWLTDGKRVAMSTGGHPNGGIVLQIADGSRAPDTLIALKNGDAWPTSVSPDGSWLAYYSVTLLPGVDPLDDLFFLDLRSRESRRVPIPGMQRGGRFSPDGQWFAYQSQVAGRDEVHVRPWPAMDADYLIAESGTEPAWAPSGVELYFRRGTDVLAMAISARAGAFERTAPRVLFSGPFIRDPSGDISYDVAPDGRFLMLRPVAGGRARVEVALNWIAEVKARLDRK